MGEEVRRVHRQRRVHAQVEPARDAAVDSGLPAGRDVLVGIRELAERVGHLRVVARRAVPADVAADFERQALIAERVLRRDQLGPERKESFERRLVPRLPGPGARAVGRSDVGQHRRVTVVERALGRDGRGTGQHQVRFEEPVAFGERGPEREDVRLARLGAGAGPRPAERARHAPARRVVELSSRQWQGPVESDHPGRDRSPRRKQLRLEPQFALLVDRSPGDADRRIEEPGMLALTRDRQDRLHGRARAGRCASGRADGVGRQRRRRARLVPVLHVADGERRQRMQLEVVPEPDRQPQVDRIERADVLQLLGEPGPLLARDRRLCAQVVVGRIEVELQRVLLVRGVGDVGDVGRMDRRRDECHGCEEPRAHCANSSRCLALV